MKTYYFYAWVLHFGFWDGMADNSGNTKTWNVHCRFSFRSYPSDAPIAILSPPMWKTRQASQLRSACEHLVHMRQCSTSTFVFDCVYFLSTCSNLFCLWMKTFTLFASLVVEAFVLSASPRLPFSSQEPCASFLSAAGPAQASRRNLRRKTSHLPHWSCPVRKKLFSFDMKCKDSRHEKGMMPRKINRLIKRR